MTEKYGNTIDLIGGSISICPFCGASVKILNSVDNKKPSIMKRTKCKHYKRLGINAMTGSRLVVFVEK